MGDETVTSAPPYIVHGEGAFGRVRDLVMWAAIAAALIACGTGSRARTAWPSKVAGEPGASAHGFSQRGLASYYSNSLAGNRTASGERYRPQEMTAAHRTLPFGTVVRVTRLDRADEDGQPHGASVVVRINDRGPFGGGGRIIDLSFAAARALGIIRAGVVMVEIVAQP